MAGACVPGGGCPPILTQDKQAQYVDRQEQSYQEEQEEESPALRPGEVSSTYFFPRINFCSRDRAGMVSEGGAKPRGNGRTEQCRQRRVGDQPRWRARGASKLLVAVLLACAASGGEGGLNHFKRNGQQTRQKLSHSSIVNTLNKGKVRQMKEAAEMAWDQQLYREGQSIVDDEDPIIRLLMSKNSLADDTRETKLIVGGKIVSGGDSKPPIPGELLELPIPRRPPRASFGTDVEKLVAAEQDEFMRWRKHLALVEDSYAVTITPYEKSPYFWRQLWRVVERSHLVLQVVDCRTPLLYRSRALEDYVAEEPEEGLGVAADGSARGGRKTHALLLNKADLVPRAVRRAWAAYFKGIGVEAFFFSAADEAPVDGEAEEDEESWEEDAWGKAMGSFDASRRGRGRDAAAGQGEEDIPLAGDGKTPAKEEEDDDESDGAGGVMRGGEILGAEELLDQLVALVRREAAANGAAKARGAPDVGSRDAPDPGDEDQLWDGSEEEEGGGGGGKGAGAGGRVTIGMVGFPNVGKSSVVNALSSGCGSKRVAHGSNPGKTKHLQTIIVREDVCLADCPGLVLPSVVSRREEMVCGGIVSLHTLKEVLAPVQLVVDSVPRAVLEERYGFPLPIRRALARPASPLQRSLDLVRAARMQRLAAPPGASSGAPPESMIVETVVATDFLDCFCSARRLFQQGSGVADHHRAAKMVLADFISGKLPHYSLPPPIPM
ncbi:hypothetical protein T484DRAFT_1880213 [Baffinella frigidus]|nr:hypothetical protein T484DRAFT_1880213 [Cryptophyta sp. CCMP2293]